MNDINNIMNSKKSEFNLAYVEDNGSNRGTLKIDNIQKQNKIQEFQHKEGILKYLYKLFY